MILSMLVEEELINLQRLCTPSLVVKGCQAAFLAHGHLYREQKGDHGLWLVFLGFFTISLSPPALHLSPWPGKFRGILCNQVEARVFRQCPRAMCHSGWRELAAGLLHTRTGLPHPVPTGFGKHTNKITPRHHTHTQKNPTMVPFSQSVWGK